MEFYLKVILFVLIVSLLILAWRFFVKKEFFFTSQHKEHMNYKTSDEEMKNRIKKAMIESNFKRIRFDEEKNIFKAVTIPSVYSTSEIIKVKIKNSKIEFLSVCLIPLQVFDWYKNERNANRFFKNLKVDL